MVEPHRLAEVTVGGLEFCLRRGLLGDSHDLALRFDLVGRRTRALAAALGQSAVPAATSWYVYRNTIYIPASGTSDTSALGTFWRAIAHERARLT